MAIVIRPKEEKKKESKKPEVKATLKPVKETFEKEVKDVEKELFDDISDINERGE